jgi:ribonuclease BN (tRNA processing enzyme)
MSLRVLGCDGSWPGPGGAGSGYLVTAGGTTVLVDAGPGTFANLQLWAEPSSIDGVILSHHHADHWTDLHALATHALLVSGRRALPVLAPAGLERLSGLGGHAALAWCTVTDGDTTTMGDLRFAFHRTDHAPETLAVRIDGGGRTLGYSADTGPGWSLAGLGTWLDLVLCEATYTAEHEGMAGHMSGRQAGEQARTARARRVVLTHRWPTVDRSQLAEEAAGAFGGPVEQAEIGKEFEL